MRRSIALLAALLTIGLYGTYRSQAQPQVAAAPLTAFEVAGNNEPAWT